MAAIRRDGLRVDGCLGAFTLHLPASENLTVQPDLVLLTAKTQDVAAAIRDNRTHLSEVPLVLLQNGVRSADLIHPVLNVRLFANPRFTWAEVGFGLVGLVLTGAMFLFTQYLEDVEGYRPFDSGLSLIPLVAGMLVAQVVSRLLPRIRTKVAMATGFTLLAASLALFGTASVHTGYGFVALCLTLMGAGLGTAMTPGLDAIMGAMPAGEFGAGSAVASTFRQVGAAIGVALLGDIYLNSYVAKLHLPTAVPAPVAHIARQSVGAANAVAAKLPAPLGEQVRGQAHAAFMSGLDWTLLLAAGVALLAAVLVAAFLPGRKPAAQALQPAMREADPDPPAPA